LCADINLDHIDDGFLKFAWQNLAPEHRARILAGSPKTFWLFGAGASHHYALNAFGIPIPLADGFFEAFHQLPTSQGFHAHVGPFISFLEHYRGVPPDQVSRWRENIEDFMTSVENALDELKEATRGREYPRSMIDVKKSWNSVPNFDRNSYENFSSYHSRKFSPSCQGGQMVLSI